MAAIETCGKADSAPVAPDLCDKTYPPGVVDGHPDWEAALSVAHAASMKANALIAKQMQEIIGLQAAQQAKQAQIDTLMLEYCPDEMTPEQTAEWARHQRPVSAEETARVNDLEARAFPAAALLAPAPTANLGAGDFTIEMFIPGVPIEQPPTNKWVHIPIERQSTRTTVHSAEEVDGVHFHTVTTYDESGALLSNSMIRSDQVRGSISDGKSYPFAKYTMNVTPPTEPFPTARQHDLYKTGDPDAPQAILDANGEVVLSLCKVCGGAEGSLPTHCPGRRMSLGEVDEVMCLGHDFKDGKWVENKKC